MYASLCDHTWYLSELAVCGMLACRTCCVQHGSMSCSGSSADAWAPDFCYRATTAFHSNDQMPREGHLCPGHPAAAVCVHKPETCCDGQLLLLADHSRRLLLLQLSLTTLCPILHIGCSMGSVNDAGEGAYTILKVTILASRGMYRSWRASRTGKVDPRGTYPPSPLQAPLPQPPFPLPSSLFPSQLSAGMC